MSMREIFSLEGRTALVTGGSRGIGRMMAEGLASCGAKVYFTSRTRSSGEATAAALAGLGCVQLQADLSTLEGIRSLAQQMQQHESSLDILVNNAGAVWNSPLEQFPEMGWDKVVDLNMKSPFFLVQALHPLLRKAGEKRRAKVVNIASIDGLTVNPLETYAYAASKAGLAHLTKRLALRLISDNIAVSAVAPGEFPSAMNRQARDEPEAVASRVPAGRVGCADDIAAAVVYLASRAGDYVVGTTLTVDGGLSLSRG